MTDDSTDRLVQLALNVTDLFDADLQMVGRAEQNSIEVARIRVHALLSSLAPELRDAVNSSFGLDGGVTVADHQDLIGRALAQLRLEPAADDNSADRPGQRQVQAA